MKRQLLMACAVVLFGCGSSNSTNEEDRRSSPAAPEAKAAGHSDDEEAGLPSQELENQLDSLEREIKGKKADRTRR